MSEVSVLSALSVLKLPGNAVMTERARPAASTASNWLTNACGGSEVREMRSSEKRVKGEWESRFDIDKNGSTRYVVIDKAHIT